MTEMSCQGKVCVMYQWTLKKMPRESAETLLSSLFAAAASAVLDCIEQSRTVVLVPTATDSCLESGLLSAVHAARVERRSRLVFIQTTAEQGPCSGSVPEALQLLAEAGDRVTWKGSSSMPLSSSFWKQLRYYLPAPQDVKKTRLLPQANQDLIWVMGGKKWYWWAVGKVLLWANHNSESEKNCFDTVCSIILSRTAYFQFVFVFMLVHISQIPHQQWCWNCIRTNC